MERLNNESSMVIVLMGKSGALKRYRNDHLEAEELLAVTWSNIIYTATCERLALSYGQIWFSMRRLICIRLLLIQTGEGEIINCVISEQKGQWCILTTGCFTNLEPLWEMWHACGTSLAVHWLRLRLPMQGVAGSIPGPLVGELRSHMPWGQKSKT